MRDGVGEPSPCSGRLAPRAEGQQRWPSEAKSHDQMEKSRKPPPTRMWTTHERLGVLVAFVFVNALLGLIILSLDDFPTTPDKWLIGSLTIITVPIIFVATLGFLFPFLERASKWGCVASFIAENALFPLLIGLDIAVFMLLSSLRRKLGALDYGAIITVGSAVIGDIAAIITIYQFAKGHKKQQGM
jgi:hypothetical protein